MLKVALAQINSRVGDLTGNTQKIVDAATRAQAQGASVLVTPELALTGYPPEDLLLRPAFRAACDQALADLAEALKEIPDLTVVVGHPRARDQHMFNAATVLRYGKVMGSYGKLELPNYAVFDEQRYFVPDGAPCLFEANGLRIAVNICEDIWAARAPAMAKAAGANLLVVLNASPFHLDKQRERIDVVRSNASRIGLPVAFCNLVGGQDELVFDGGSFVLDANGSLIARAPQFQEDLLVVDFFEGATLAGESIDTIAPDLSVEQQAYQALVLGTRDYVTKNGFQGAVIGLSGGVDSALVLAIAADALGPEHVRAVIMPSPFTAAMSVEDAKACAQALGVKADVIDITALYEQFKLSLSEVFTGRPEDVTEENIQARIRGTLLMAISNKTSALVLVTGNKSETAVGYCTLYGDMAGGFAVIKDLFKGMVYRLCHERNRIAVETAGLPVIPQRILSRAPSAELRPDQTDQDSLPPYDALDDMLSRFIEHGETRADLIAAGYASAEVDRVLRMVRHSEYKRRQSAPGVRISKRAFGRDWRYPLTNRFEESSQRTTLSRKGEPT
ncbi:MAG: NAD+ synthase [Burkholderiaceae bacterium]|jgi:NAD+ synthase (glutamine-hydrolysing)|nr:NAD+ synthase [Burkholderiaceae bacterium]